MSILKSLLCGWLFKAWAHVNKPYMIKVGWYQCGLLPTFDSTNQVQTIDQNMKIPLFATESSALQKKCIEKDDDIDTYEAIDKVM